MDPGKTQAVTEWPNTTELQQVKAWLPPPSPPLSPLSLPSGGPLEPNLPSVNSRDCSLLLLSTMPDPSKPIYPGGWWIRVGTLLNLPNSKETAEALSLHVFQIHGLPLEVTFHWKGHPQKTKEVEVPSAQLLVHRACLDWEKARLTLLKDITLMKRYANCYCRPAPHYTMCQRVWLSTRDIPLRAVCFNFAPRFIGPLRITRVLTPSAERLNLPPPLRLYVQTQASRHLLSSSSSQNPSSSPNSSTAASRTPCAGSLRYVTYRGQGHQFLVRWDFVHDCCFALLCTLTTVY